MEKFVPACCVQNPQRDVLQLLLIADRFEFPQNRGRWGAEPGRRQANQHRTFAFGLAFGFADGLAFGFSFSENFLPLSAMLCISVSVICS